MNPREYLKAKEIEDTREFNSKSSDVPLACFRYFRFPAPRSYFSSTLPTWWWWEQDEPKFLECLLGRL